MADDVVAPLGRFVGREAELRQIERACERAARGRGSVIVVSGEAGVGKTRLCEEAAVRAERLGLRVVPARCWVEGGAPPLWPWPPLVAELCDAAAAGLLGTAGEAGGGDSGYGAATVDPDRFARFVAVTSRLAAACDTTPACVIIDDIQTAEAGALLLTRFVARSLSRLRLVLVLSRRSGEPNGPGTTARLLEEIERDATTPLVLRRFDPAETTAFLDAHGMEGGDPDLVQALQRVTGGNPLFLRRIVALGTLDPARALPEGLRAAIDTAIDGLPDQARRILAAGAVLGLSPSVTETAALTGATPADVFDAVTRAAEVGLAAFEPGDRFGFTHELVRVALDDRLSSAQRLAAHATAAGIAGALTPDDLARRAHHLLRAAPRSTRDARRAVDGCRAAARAMIGSFAYEEADALLSAAVELHRPTTLGPPPGALLVEWAEATLQCGRLADARVRFDRAALAAEHEGDPLGFADAALGMGGVWLNERRDPVERTRVLAQQRSALARLPAGETGRRCRLEVRLAAEAVYDGGPVAPVLAALERARRCGDPRAHAEALSLTHHTVLAPEHAGLRLELADELVRVASEAGLGVLALMGLCWRAVDLFLLGDPGAPRALEDLRRHADALASENVLYMVDAIDVMRLIRAGRLDEAEAAAEACHARGTAAGDVDAFGYLGAHMLAIRWVQGREAELSDRAEEIARSSTLVQAEFAFQATAAAFAARAGRRDRARAALDHLAAGGLAALPRSSTWFTGMFAIVEASAQLGDGNLARQAHDLLLPHADLPVMPSLAVACLGSARRAIGVAATTFGELDQAVDQLSRAIDANRLLGHRPLVAISQADLARALLQREAPGDLAQADELLRTALDEAAAMGLTGRTEDWQELQALVAARRSADTEGRSQPQPREPAPGRTAHRTGAAARQGVIRRQGRAWAIGIDARQVLVGDLVGMRYLAELLAHPGEPITALELVAGGSPGPAEPSRHELLDETAQGAYVDHARAIADELAEAEADNDIERAAKLRAELDAVVDHLAAATGLAGRARTFVSPGERARTSVRKAIMRAIDEIAAADPGIARHLRSTITTGYTCAYTGDPNGPIHWWTRPEPTAP